MTDQETPNSTPPTSDHVAQAAAPHSRRQLCRYLSAETKYLIKVLLADGWNAVEIYLFVGVARDGIRPDAFRKWLARFRHRMHLPSPKKTGRPAKYGKIRRRLQDKAQFILCHWLRLASAEEVDATVRRLAGLRGIALAEGGQKA